MKKAGGARFDRRKAERGSGIDRSRHFINFVIDTFYVKSEKKHGTNRCVRRVARKKDGISDIKKYKKECAAKRREKIHGR